MYRQYEDPHAVEAMLYEAIEQRDRAMTETPDDIDRIIDLENEVASLRERVNFAWQDNEYDEQYASDWRPGDAPWEAPGMSASDFIR